MMKAKMKFMMIKIKKKKNRRGPVKDANVNSDHRLNIELDLQS